MKLTQSGDKEAYERLLLEISPLVFNFVRKRVYDQDQIEDVYQEVLLAFHKAKHNYRDDLPLAPWFFAVIRNAIWGALKRNHRNTHREVPLEETLEIAAPEAMDDGIDDRLHQAMDSLPEKNRKAIELLKFKGLDVEAAAKTLGISKIALRVRAHRGYSLLKKILKTQTEKTNE
jgi:RNA polymerase sigma-70 factor (ECF subfamily)